MLNGGGYVSRHKTECAGGSASRSAGVRFACTVQNLRLKTHIFQKLRIFKSQTLAARTLWVITRKQMEKDNYSATLTIKPTDLLISLEQVLEECSNSILLGFTNLDQLNQNPEHQLTAEDGFHIFGVYGKKYDLVSRKKIFRNWILKKGFEDLIKAATNSLISANVVLDLKKELAKRNNRSTFKEFINLIRDPSLSQNPTKRHFPELLKNIRPSLSSELVYEKEIQSINNIRKCLVHRNGLVTHVDTFGKDELTMKWVAIQAIYKKDNTSEITEIMEPRVLVGPGEFDTRIVSRSRTFKMNEQIEFDFKEFNELIWTIKFFGDDLISKFQL